MRWFLVIVVAIFNIDSVLAESTQSFGELAPPSFDSFLLDSFSTQAGTALTSTNPRTVPQIMRPAPQVKNNGVGSCASYFSREECDVLRITNLYRSRNGLSKLSPSRACHNLAKAHSQNMAAQGFFSHRNFSSRMRAYGLGGGSENIAKGQRSADQVVRDWMNSPGHRRNILSPRAKYLGVGKVGTLWTQCFSY